MTEDGGAPTAAAPVVMGTLGRVEEYEHHKEDWPQYVERLSHFFEANAITTPERKRSCLFGSGWCNYLQGAARPCRSEQTWGYTFRGASAKVGRTL